MKTDIEIARETPLAPINQIAEQTGIPATGLDNYGRYIGKVDEKLIDEERVRSHHLILVTSISPTKAGVGKTTVSIGLTLGLNKIGRRAMVALREPSLGPCFGIKGGAAGGGYAQVLPMEKINLHFTGDFHAITSAHNTLSALLDNYLYQHRDEGMLLKEIYWKRVLDVNDRSLRHVLIGEGGGTNGIERDSGFDITPASELMAILCLATSLEDLRRRIGVVPQKAMLFKGTIRENLLWGNAAAADEELLHAAALAQAEDVLAAKGGLDGKIEQNGRNLSGGQRQRLTIARALVRKPEILILDDSSSALDFATDAALRRALRSLDGNPTVFIVSQRTSSIQHADQIVVLDEGTVAGIGTHDELLKNCSVYREIYDSQFRKEGAQA